MNYLGKKIGVLMGGLSAEREVSLKSGTAMAQALERRGYHIIRMDIRSGNELFQRLNQEAIELAVIALHGPMGEDGKIQGVLEWLQIPYTGSGVTASAICMDKALAKKIFRDAEIPTPPWWEISVHKTKTGVGPGEIILPLDLALETSYGTPFFIKPLCSGSSCGILQTNAHLSLEQGLRQAAAAQETGGGTPLLLVEKGITGTEVTLSVLNGEPLPLIEIRPVLGFYDYTNKYTSGRTQYLIPPPSISTEVMQKAIATGLAAGKATNCRGLYRVDMMIDKEDHIWVLEINTIPGMTELSLAPQAAAAAGIVFDELVERILQGAALEPCGAT
ncbi:MAG: D-alanine--D-alanine ligase [Magnetococcus sp. DMHC-6]